MQSPDLASPPRLGIPPSECMIPGETYVGIPPGHSRPAFVRKRPVDAGRPPWFLTNIFGSSKRAYTVEGPPSSGMFRRSSWRDRCDRYERSYYPYGTPYTNRYNPQVSFARPGTVHDTPLGPVAARVNQVCGSCGRYRYVLSGRLTKASFLERESETDIVAGQHPGRLAIHWRLENRARALFAGDVRTNARQVTTTNGGITSEAVIIADRGGTLILPMAARTRGSQGIHAGDTMQTARNPEADDPAPRVTYKLWLPIRLVIDRHRHDT